MPSKTPLTNIMNHDFINLQSDTTAKEAAKTLTQNNLEASPVVDEDNNLIGVLKKDDLFKTFINGLDTSTPIKEIMEKNIVTIDDEETLDHAWKAAAENKSDFIIVVDHQKRVKGTLTTLELIKAAEKYITRFEWNHLDAVIESSFDGIVISDREGYLLKINQAYERITGLKPEEILGRNVKDLVKEGILSPSSTLEVLKNKKSTTISQVLKTGKEMLVTGNPIFNEGGEITHVISNCRDLTELNNIRKQLDETTRLNKKYYAKLKELEKKHLQDNHINAKSPAMQKVIDLALKVSEVDCNVLILGETGVGKEVIARFIHENSSRANDPFVKINCGAIPENLLESELFGYEEGAFTGAKKKGKQGSFELAGEGTLLLDEIGDLPLNLQVKLLNVLQDKEFKRVGGVKSIPLNSRIIAATNRDLKKKTLEGTFRLDLYYRLDVVSINIPPLRERNDDILPFAMHFLKKFNEKYDKNKNFDSRAIDFLYKYHWPGNVRELENLIERLVVTTQSYTITAEHLPSWLVEGKGSKTTSSSSNFPFKETEITIKEDTSVDKSKLDPGEEEKQTLLNLYKKYRSTHKVARVLGVNQSTVVRKMKKYNLSPKKIKEGT